MAAPTRLGWRVPAVRLGGVVFERTSAYDAVWWLAVLFGVLSAVINFADRREAGAAARARCRNLIV